MSWTISKRETASMKKETGKISTPLGVYEMKSKRSSTSTVKTKSKRPKLSTSVMRNLKS